jgi:hypothetical protein
MFCDLDRVIHLKVYTYLECDRVHKYNRAINFTVTFDFVVKDTFTWLLSVMKYSHSHWKCDF